jgi:hypothetical protein
MRGAVTMATISGIFNSVTDTESAVQELIASGWARDDISVVASQQDAGKSHPNDLAIKDAEKGALVGGLAGLFLGLSELAIPGVGLVVVGGWLAVTLLGAGVGATAGGLVGALVEAGMGHEEASGLAERVRGGGTLLIVKTGIGRRDEAAAILDRHGAVNVQ